MTFLLKLLGYVQNPELANKINNSYHSLRVVGRGCVKADIEEVCESIRQQGLYAEARKVVTGL